MKMNKILIIIMLSALLVVSAYAQDQNQDLTAISAKLDQILNNEKVLMDEIASMKQELNVIKIRVTQSQ